MSQTAKDVSYSPASDRETEERQKSPRESAATDDVGDESPGQESSEFGSAAPTTESDGTPVENPSGG